MTMTNTLQLNLINTLTRTVGASDVTAATSKRLSSTDYPLTGADAILTIAAAIDAGGSNSYDLQGAETDPLGAAVTFAAVKAILFRNLGENAMQLGGAGNIPLLSGATDKLNVDAAGMVLAVGDIAVTAGTADSVTVTGTAGDTFELIVVGTAPAA